MEKVWIVARREFLATVRTRAFLLSVVLMPGLIMGAVYGTQVLERAGDQQQREVRKLALIDRSGRLEPLLTAQIEAHNQERPHQPFELEPLVAESAQLDKLAQEVRAGERYAYIEVPAEILSTPGASVIVARRDSQLEAQRRLSDMLNTAVFLERCVDQGLDPNVVAGLRRPVGIEWADVQTGAAVATNPFTQFMTAFAFMFLLFMGTFAISQGLLTTLIEEKGSRVIEVLLSAVSPTQLLAGKIVGTACVGVVLMAVWGSVGVLAARRFDVLELVNTYRLVMALLYFVPGFLLIAALLAAIGSACNELKEAQSMAFPLSLVTMIPVITWYYIAEHPTSTFSLLLSYLPPVTPFVMILRICGDPTTPLWQIFTTLALLWVSVVVMMWAAARVFRVGVLMYGKPPTPGELLHWVRYR
ncbi:MAG: ABC transporter permease [Phycisphaerales bacterium]|nr:ABC transporter permease [Phycisphaerales bacterium]